MGAPARRVLFLTVFIDLMGFGIVVPMLAFCAREYGASGLTLGLIMASFSLMQFIFLPIWGRLSDRIGRRPVLMASLFGNVLGFGTFAFATNVAMLFATRILSGIAAASISTAQAYVADTTDEAHRAKGMTIISMAFGLGLVLGPPLGGTLSGLSTSLRFRPSLLPGAVAAAFSAISLIMAVFALPESLVRTGGPPGHKSLIDNESWRIFARSRRLRLAGGSLAVLMCTLSAISPILVLVGRDQFHVTAREVGYLFGVMGVVVVTLQVTAVHRLTQRFGDVATGILGAVAVMLGLLVILFATTRGMLVVATCLLGAGQGLCHPTLSAYISKVAPPTHRGGILGVSSALTALARVFGPPLAGLTYDAMNAPGALLSQTAVVIVGILLAAQLIRAREGV